METTGLGIHSNTSISTFDIDKERIWNGKKGWGYDAYTEAAIMQLAKRHVLGQSNID